MRVFKSAISLLALSAAIAAHAQIQYQTSYTVNFPTGSPSFDITNIMLLEDGPGFGSTTWPFGVSSPFGGTITNPFPFNTPPTSSLVLGLTHDLPGDAPGQEHVVMFMDDTAASLGANIAWGTLFRNTDEDQLISDIKLATSGQDWPIIQPGLDAVGAFANGDAQTGILDNLAQPHSAWFTTGGTFTIESWSSGTILGSGISSVTAVPEPVSLSVLGMGLVGLARRRRKA